MKSWFQKPQSGKSKVPKSLFRLDLKPEIIDIIVLLHRLWGKTKALNFIEQFFFLLQIVYVDPQYID